jgi:copper/silver efflux system protein
MVGGLVTSFALELLVYPALYLLWKRRAVDRDQLPA